MKKVYKFLKELFETDSPITLSFVLFLFLMLMAFIQNEDGMRNLILNSENSQFWVSMAAIGAAFSFVIATKDRRAQSKADLVSKARIEWLKQGRELSSKLSSETHTFLLTANTVASIRMLIKEHATEKTDISDALKKLDKATDLISSTRREAVKTLSSFKLLFGPQNSNDDIINSAEELYSFIESCNDLVLSGEWQRDSELYKVKIEDISILGAEYLDVFNLECRKYFYKEWNRAKKGE